MSVQVEMERKFEVPEQWQCPVHIEGFQLGRPSVVSQKATYLDTLDLTLLRSKHTLRRRTGGTDAGWHLKTPGESADARHEHHAPLGASVSAVPVELRENLRDLVGAQALLPVADLATRRTIREVRAGEGVVALILDDAVVADVRSGAADRLAWREVEIELVNAGTQEHLDALTHALVSSGAEVSPVPSKLSRAMAPALQRVGERLQRASVVERGYVVDDAIKAKAPKKGSSKGASAKGGTTKKSKVKLSKLAQEEMRVSAKKTLRAIRAAQALTAADVITAYLAEQVGALQSWEQGVRTDAPDAVHASRVATRRLRSTLKTFRPLFDVEKSEPLRSRIAWWTTVLGGARDAEVMLERILASAAALDRADRVGPVTARIRTTLGRTHTTAHREVVAQLEARRYRALLADLMDFVAAPPFTALADEPAGEVLPKLVRSATRKVRTRAAAVALIADEAERNEAIHDVRKLAKAARYAAEAAGVVAEPEASQAISAWKQVQEVLGDFQDSVVAQKTLGVVRREAKAAGEDTFTYGVLVERERRFAHDQRAQFDPLLKAALKAAR